jgi:hypothetical protein
MSNTFDPKFDDPVLKDALRRALGNETAPVHLRARVERAIEAERAAAGRTDQARRSWRNSPLVGLAAAAALLISVGLIYNHFRSESGDDSAQIELPQSLALAMIVTADQGAAAHEANLVQNVGAPDYTMLTQTLREKLGHPVMVASLGPDWTLKSAGVSRLSEVPASHMVFTRGQDSVSLFSLSGARFYATQEGSDYAQMEAGRPIAGFVYKGAVHCVVGGSGMSLKEVTKLRDKLRSSLSMTSSSSGCGTPAESVARATI